jgi:hypothetical protein
MNLLAYAGISAIIIFIWMFAFSIKPYGEERDFNVFLLISVFVFGGFIGWYLKSIEAAFLISIILSLVFV